MGKSLIIKGADFSANSIGRLISLTSQFTWTDGYGVVALSTHTNYGNTASSTAFKASNVVSVSSYQGQTMQIASCKYKTSSSQQSPYGIVFYNSSNEPVGSYQFPNNTSGSAGTGAGETAEITIPSTATTVKATYFTAANQTAFGAQDFFCIIV